MHAKKEAEVLLKELRDLALRKANYLFSKKIILEGEAFNLMKLFFKGYFEVEHEISFIDIITFTKKSNLPTDSKEKVVNFINQLSKILYSGADFTQKELHIMINDFRTLVSILIEEKKRQNIVDKSVKKVIKMPFIKRLFIRKKNLKEEIEPEKDKEKVYKTKTYNSVREKLIDQMKHVVEEENTLEKEIPPVPIISENIQQNQIFNNDYQTESQKQNQEVDLNELLLKDFKKDSSIDSKAFDKKSDNIIRENIEIKRPIQKKVKQISNLKQEENLDWTSDAFNNSNTEEDNSDFLEEPKKYYNVKFDMFSKINGKNLTPKINADQDKEDKDEMIDKIRKLDNNIEYLSKSVNDSPKKKKELLKKIMKIEIMEDRLSNILDKNKKKVYHKEIDSHLDKHITENNVAARIDEYIQRMKAKKIELSNEIKKVPAIEKETQIPEKKQDSFIHPHTEIHIKSEDHPSEDVNFFSNYKEDNELANTNDFQDEIITNNKKLDDKKYEDILNKAKEYIASSEKNKGI